MEARVHAPARTRDFLQALGGLPHLRRPPAFVLVPSLLIAAAMALPLLYLAIRAGDAGGDAWGLVARGRTAAILGRSLLLMAVVTGTSVVVAMPLAWLTTRAELPFRRGWAVATALPLVIPSYVGGFLVISALGPRGLLQQTLSPLGVERLPEIYGLGGAALTLTLLSFPYVLLPVRAALTRLDPALEESARSLGMNNWQVFWKVVAPQLTPSLAAGALLVALYTLSDFGAVSLLRYETFTWAIYQQYESALDRSIAAALSLLLVCLALVLLVAEARARGRSAYHRAATGAARLGALHSLGRFKWPALAFCGSVVAASLLAPVGVLLYWSASGLGAVQPLSPLGAAAVNSLVVASSASAIAVLSAIPVVLMSVRYAGPLAWLVERASFTGYALPGLVVAISLVFFGVRYGGPLYQSHALLVFGYLVLFLPTALGAIRSSLLQVSPRLEEAARSLGETPFKAFVKVTLPPIRPGILAAAGLVFLVTMKELPATLILGPLGFTSLATMVWSSTTEALFAQAALPALLLIAISAGPMTFLVLREPRWLR